MVKKAPHFIQNAVPPANRGKFTEKAKRAGEGVQEYAQQVLKPGSGASSTTKHEAQFARNMQSIANKNKITRLSKKQ